MMGDRELPRRAERSERLAVTSVELRKILDEDQTSPLNPGLEHTENNIERLTDQEDNEAGDKESNVPGMEESDRNLIDHECQDDRGQEDTDESSVGEDVAQDFDEAHDRGLHALAGNHEGQAQDQYRIDSEQR